MTGLLDDLDPAQRDAVTTTEGYVRVIAGAGSGKTRALTRRFAYLVTGLGIPPGNILCVTFTNKAAGEMRQRIHALTGDRDTGFICTFHSFCDAVLREDSHAVQYPRQFLVLDNADIDDMLRIVYEERGLTLRDMSFRDARDMIEIRKLFEVPDYYLDMISLSLEELRQKYLAAREAKDVIFYGYLYQEKKCFGLDYNDLILFTLYLFSEHPRIRLKWQQRLEYIMIDEFQDIDSLQYDLMRVLCAHHNNLFVVGDPDQTIYTWRGASVKYLLDFDSDFPDVKTILMTNNYRSTPQILNVVNSLIGRNRDRIRKTLSPTRPDGASVLCHHGETAEAEARWIAGQIKDLLRDGISCRDIAVLYRAHYITRVLEGVFQEEKIPYAVFSGTPFWARSEIKDALSYLRMAAYQDDVSFRRIINTPKRNIGKTRLRFLEEQAREHGCSLYEALRRTLEDGSLRNTKGSAFVDLIEALSPGCGERPISDLLSALLDRSGYEAALRTEGSRERLDNLAELKQSVFEYEASWGEETTLEHYLDHIALLTANDQTEQADKVRLMTVHAAKGLEFPFVFLCAMNEGVFPGRRVNSLERMEEERRLAFVAMTRAEDRLFLSESEGRNLDGSCRYPSRFLLDIDRELLEYTAPPKQALLRDARSYIETSDRYMPENLSELILPAGQRVRHAVFGCGTVLGADRDRHAHIIRFDGLETTRSVSFKIPLETL